VARKLFSVVRVRHRYSSTMRRHGPGGVPSDVRPPAFALHSGTGRPRRASGMIAEHSQHFESAPIRCVEPGQVNGPGVQQLTSMP